jgi:hypothetical protein
MQYQQRISGVPSANGMMEISSEPISKVKHLKAEDVLRK